jgi:hypothetical protein
MKINLSYNPTEKQKDIICLMQGYLGIEILTLLGVLAL